MTKTFYKKADGIIITYDITQNMTFEGVANWIQSITEHAGVDVCSILVGNKCDLTEDRKVLQIDAEKFAKDK